MIINLDGPPQGVYWAKYFADWSSLGLVWGVAAANSIVAVVIGHVRGRGWRLFGGNLAAFSRRMHREMELLAEAGVPPARLLQAATANAVEALGVGDRLGRVAPSFELDDIRNTRGIRAVILNGRFFTGEQLAELKGESR